MDLFFVQKEGVYAQGVFGIYSNVERAVDVAKHLAKNDGDDYHKWCVYPISLDRIPRIVPWESYSGYECEDKLKPPINQENLLFSVNKSGVVMELDQ